MPILSWVFYLGAKYTRPPEPVKVAESPLNDRPPYRNLLLCPVQEKLAGAVRKLASLGKSLIANWIWDAILMAEFLKGFFASADCLIFRQRLLQRKAVLEILDGSPSLSFSIGLGSLRVSGFRFPVCIVYALIVIIKPTLRANLT